ncbi:MAG: NAD-dependent epimerase/dehydratase family protein [Candidatus Theseobacter exili]|nr:NAD-dependent epimerase/dehydratase family protein [Candidatus Theseobacter exili]
MKNCLVTGGAGFIGSNLSERLLFRGCNVRILVNLSTGNKRNLEHLADRIDLMLGDLRNINDVDNALKGMDSVFHLGAIPSVSRSINNTEDTMSANVMGTTILLDSAVNNNVKRVVFASPSSVYGDTPSLPKVETMAPRPRSPYALSKLTGEMLCENFSRLKGLETIALRFFNVFGVHQDPESEYAAVIPKFVTALLKRERERPTVFGDGLQSRDFTPVENVVDALIKAMETPDGAAGTVFNVGCGRSFSLISVLEMLGEILQIEPNPVFLASRPGDVKHSLADINAAKERLGYNPHLHFKEGLEKTVAWFQGEINVPL